MVLALLFALAAQAWEIPGNRVASVSVSEEFLNEQLRAHVKSELAQDLRVSLDPDKDEIFFRGVTQIPVEELRAINLDPSLGKFRFQVAAKLRVSKRGYLVIEFPLDETFFTPVGSKDPRHDRVIVPVQMLSIAIASVRGYLAALSGDFAGFDRRAAKLEALKKALERAIAAEKNADALDDLRTQRESLRLQIAAIPIERKQLQSLAKEFAALVAFTGEKEIDLNDDLKARRNALMLKIKLSQLVPYLDGYALGGVRLRHDKKDGAGRNYVSVDLNADLATPAPSFTVKPPADRKPMKTPPALLVRLSESIFDSKAITDLEKSEAASDFTDMSLSFEDDGLHVNGHRKFLFLFRPSFSAIVDFEPVRPDVFDVKLRDAAVAGIDVGFLENYALESVKRRLNHVLKGLCRFRYIGEQKDHSRALRVTVDPAALVPAVPGLHLLNVDIREKEFLLKVGRL